MNVQNSDDSNDLCWKRLRFPRHIKLIMRLAAVPIALSISGCFGWQPFQPPPPEFKSWSKQGVSPLEVQKAMLECGYSSPFEDRLNQEDFARTYMCMKHSGFIFDSGRYDFCANSPYLRACQFGSFITKREIDRRLNSSFCHIHPDHAACK